MAERVEALDGGNARAIYDWDGWIEEGMKGFAVELKQGVDFQCTLASFRVYAHSIARGRGLKLVTRTVSPGVMRIHFKRPEAN